MIGYTIENSGNEINTFYVSNVWNDILIFINRTRYFWEYHIVIFVWYITVLVLISVLPSTKYICYVYTQGKILYS